MTITRHQRAHWLLVASIVLPLALLALFAWQSYLVRIEAAEDASRRNARIIAEHASRMLDLHFKIIDLVNHTAVYLDGTALDQLLSHEMLGSRPGRILAVVDGNGVVTHSSRPDQRGASVADRGYFRRAMASAQEVSVVGRPIIDEIGGEEVFALALRRHPPATGITTVSLRSGYFVELFREVSNDPNAVSALIRDDGVFLARDPRLETPSTLSGDRPLFQLDESHPEATYRVTAQTDGRERIYTSIRLVGYPLIVSHGVDLAAVLSGWYRNLAIAAMAAFAAASLLASMSFMMMRQARADRETEARLQLLVARRTAEAVQRAEEAERATVRMSRFFAAASHDLRQPAQAMRLLLDAALSTRDPARQQAAVEHAALALKALEDLLQALLDVSVLESGTIEPALQDVPLGPLLADLAREAGPSASQKGLALRVAASSAVVRSDPVLLRRLLGNLMSNAIKYTEAGGVLIGCRRDGYAVRIEVWDTGIGIGEDHRQHIFDDFYQVGNAARDRRLGLGLGLGIVRRTAELLGHAVECRSRPGKGSVFAIIASSSPPAFGIVPLPEQTEAAARNLEGCLSN